MPVFSRLKYFGDASTALRLLILPFVAIAVAGCGRSTASKANEAFLDELKPVVDADSYNSMATGLAWLNSLEGRSQLLPSIARNLFEIEADGRSQAWASNAVWSMVSLEGLKTDHRPAKSIFGKDWKPGFYIVPHLEPAPAKYAPMERNPIPLETRLVLRFVPTEVAEKTKYTVARPSSL